jgi:hypothetical protein
MDRQQAEAFADKFVMSLPQSPLRSLTPSAWAVLEQLSRGPVWDGNLVSKEGRTELVNLGLAQRVRRDECGLAINELADNWQWLAGELRAA